jgi:hypothetical protein
MFSPTKSALLQAVKNGHWVTWPGLTEKAINKDLKLTPATIIGHMNQWRQNIRLTSKTPINSDIEDATVTPEGLGTNPPCLCGFNGKISSEVQQRATGTSWYVTFFTAIT